MSEGTGNLGPCQARRSRPSWFGRMAALTVGGYAAWARSRAQRHLRKVDQGWVRRRAILYEKRTAREAPYQCGWSLGGLRERLVGFYGGGPSSEDAVPVSRIGFLARWAQVSALGVRSAASRRARASAAGFVNCGQCPVGRSM